LKNLKKIVVISVTNDLATDQRVQKVAQTLLNMGFEVLLVGRLLKGSLPVPHYKHHRMKLFFTKGVAFYAAYHFRLFLFLLFKKADVLVANDLDTLLPNYLISKIKGLPLVYDSHEYYTEVPELQGNPTKKKIWLGVEQFIFPKLKKVFTVNASIAQIYEEKYKVKLNVLRNVPRKSHLQLDSKATLRKQLNLPLDKKIIIMQGSGINVSRGGEEAVEAMQFVENTLLYIIGAGDAISLLKQMVIDLKLQDTVIFIAKLPYRELLNYTACADAGLTLDKDNNLNYRYSLPNKLFDYFACGLPVIASKLVEIEKIHHQFPFGILLPEVTAQSVAAAIQSVDVNATEYQAWLINIKKASEILCWENEEKIIEEVYRDLLK
jgi:glycosyltransferase involved in cell wall biosynthesis